MSKLSNHMLHQHTAFKLKEIINQNNPQKMSNRILVTGGTGLVGKGLEDIIKEEISSGLNNEEWYFIGSKEGDLTYVCLHCFEELQIILVTTSTHISETWTQPGYYFKNINQLMLFI